MKAKISDKNSKLGNIPNVSLTPITSCVNCKFCKKDCYAMKHAYIPYKTVRTAWDFNFDMFKNDRKSYFSSINEFIQKKRPHFFRWHVGGDIPNQIYLTNMIRIAKQNPETIFLAFTKNFGLDFRNVPKNLSIVFSMWPGMKKPVHKKGVSGFAWMQDGSEKRAPKTAVICPGNCETCGMCFNISKIGSHVVFHKH